MDKKLHFNQNFKNIHNLCKKVSLKQASYGFAFLSMLTFGNTQAQTSATVPSDNSLNTGNFSLFSSSIRNYQIIIDDTQLTALDGKMISSISFRVPNNTAQWPATNPATSSSFSLYVGKGVDPVDRQYNFDANYVAGTKTLVRSGAISIPVGAFAASTAANPYNYEFTFSTPWLYTAGSNLVLEIRHTGFAGSSTPVFASTVTAAGYGTLRTSIWSSDATAAPANATFASVKINAVDNLDVVSVEFTDDNLQIYPNPSSDVVYIKGSGDLKTINVFASDGKKVYTDSKLGANPSLKIANWPSGIYYIQTIDKKGNTVSSKFVKE